MLLLEPYLVKKAQSRVAGYLTLEHNKLAFFTQDFARNSGKRIYIEECDFKDRDNVLSRVCQTEAIINGMCFNVDGDNPGYLIELNHTSLSLVHEQFVAPSYIIEAEHSEFVLVSDSDYYWGIAADENFIELMCSGDPIHAIQEFQSGIRPYVESKLAANQQIGEILLNYSSIAMSSWNV